MAHLCDGAKSFLGRGLTLCQPGQKKYKQTDAWEIFCFLFYLLTNKKSHLIRDVLAVENDAAEVILRGLQSLNETVR